MLETVIYNQGEYTFPSLLVLGCFDAIHIGHRELLKKAKLQAKINGLDLGVMLFRDGKNGKTIFTLDERIKLLESYNVKFVLLVDFNDDFKKITAADFLNTLENQLNLKGIMSGKDFRFGAGAKGKSSTLKNYADDEENGIWYMPVKDVTVNGEKVSTSHIKELLENGEIAEANALLGSNFTVTGTVVHGHNRGVEYCFPTVNITYPDNKIQIKHAVYKVRSNIDGTEYSGIANYGGRPTFGENECVLEVNYDGFSGWLYDREITVEFIDYIREIETFDNAAELAAQLEADKRSIEEAPEEETVGGVTESTAEFFAETAANTEAHEEAGDEIGANTENENNSEEIGNIIAEVSCEPPAGTSCDADGTEVADADFLDDVPSSASITVFKDGEDLNDEEEDNL